MRSRQNRRTKDEPRPPDTGADARGRQPRRRWLRRVGIAALTLAALGAVSTTVNLLAETRERAATIPYGVRVPVAGGALNVWRSGSPGPTIVLLSGLGTVAPALDFAPLVRQLDDYDVVVVERFGYGYADMTGPPQNVQNITAEIHEALSKVRARKPYVLVAHSIAGFYALSYVNRYPDEVSAVIGIDPTVPAAKMDAAEPADGGLNLKRILALTGVVRAVISIDSGIAEPPGAAFTSDELERIRRMTIWNYGNPAMTDETRRVASNAAALRGITYPASLPVLYMLASESVTNIPGWVEQHEEQLRKVRRHDVIVLDGPHYLHWTQANTMARMMTDFLAGE